VVTATGLIGLIRSRRRRGAELLLVQAAYFTAASLATISVPRLRLPLDLAAAIGAGLLATSWSPSQARARATTVGRAAVVAAQLVGPRAPEAPEPVHVARAAWSRRTRIVVTLSVIVGVIVAAGGVALARNRVEDNAESQLHRTLERDGPIVERLAGFDPGNLIAGAIPPSETDFENAQRVADRLWLLSPRLSSGLRTESRAAARELDDGLLDVHVLALLTSADHDLSSARATYETQIRPDNERLPGWDALSANTRLRRAARDLDHLERELSRT